MTPRTWAEIETDKLCQKVGCFVEPAITLAFLQEHWRAVRIVKREIERVKKDQHTYHSEERCLILGSLETVLKALQRGRE